MQGDPDKDPGTITSLLRLIDAGSREALEQLFVLIEPDLRRYAQRILCGRASRDTSGTELVSQAFVRLLDGRELNAQNRGHLFFKFGRAMRDSLVDEARRNGAAKRGGNVPHETIVDFTVDDRTMQFNVLALREALAALEKVDPAGAEVVQLRFFLDLTLEETAKALQVSVGKVRDDWNYASAWLKDYLQRHH